MRLAKGSFLTLSSEMLGQGHNLYCRTIGSSMFSLIRSRSLIQVQPVEMEHLRPGDVILYRSGEVLVAHRFLREEQERGRKRLITRGDAFPWSATEPLTPEQVLGRVMAVEWPLGLKLRIDQDPGRLLSFLLAKIATLLLPVYLALSRVKQSFFSLLSSPKKTGCHKGRPGLSLPGEYLVISPLRGPSKRPRIRPPL